MAYCEVDSVGLSERIICYWICFNYAFALVYSFDNFQIWISFFTKRKIESVTHIT